MKKKAAKKEAQVKRLSKKLYGCFATKQLKLKILQRLNYENQT